MKTAGIALKWVGIVYLLKSIGIIQVIDWSIVLPVILIIAGSSLKHCKFCKHGVMCRMGGKCEACASGEGHKCSGPDCAECKK